MRELQRNREFLIALERGMTQQVVSVSVLLECTELVRRGPP